MKKLIISSLSILLLSTIAATNVKAQEFEADNAEKVEEGTEMRTSPFALVSAAYRGRFEDQNIPGYANLQTEYEAGNISAQDVVDAGVEAGELTPQASSDDEYVSYVDSELGALTAP